MMPWGVAAAVGGSIAGGLVQGAMSPSTSGGTSYYVPTGLGTADQTWQSLLGNLNNVYNTQNLDQYGLSSLQGGVNAGAQYGPGYQAAADSAAGTYAGLASYLNNLAQQNQGTQNQLLGAGQNVYNMGLDPQNALYNRTLQQVTDQSNAVNSMYGLGSSAAGAGLTNQAIGNFNIDWQNNELSRALQGLQGYTGAANEAGRYGQLGMQQAQLAPGYALESGQLPYTTAQTIAATPGSLANTYGSFLNQNVYGPAEGIMGTIIPYMNYGQGAQSVPYQNAANNAAAWGGTAGNAVNSIFSNPTVQNGISNIFSPASGSFSGGDFSGAFSSNPYYGGSGNSWGFTMAA
jgi:hypothetical protein